MITSVGVANPGTISGTSVATGVPTISGVNVATNVPTISGVVNANTPPPAPVAPPTVYPSIYGANGPTPEVLAPTPDFNTIFSNANARANTDVNATGYYQKQINDFIANQAAQQATQTAVKDQALKVAQQQLENTTAANDVTGQRTTADTAAKEAVTNKQADWRQTDQGGNYDMNRIADAVATARAGGTGSGLSAGKDLATQTAFNTKESRQATGDQQTIDYAELAKARTFEDLATSNKLAGQDKANKDIAANFNLSSFIQAQSMDLAHEQQATESARQAKIAATTDAYRKSAIQDYFNNISNPAQKAAFAKAYGSMF